jgi:hypothetical protein
MQSILVYQIKPDPGVFAKSFLPNDVMFISSDKLLPMSRFTNPSAGSGAASGGRSSRGGGGRAMRLVFGIYLFVFLFLQVIFICLFIYLFLIVI